MGLLERLKTLVTPANKKAASSIYLAGIPLQIDSIVSQYVDDLYRENVDYYSVVKKIVELASVIQFKLYEYDAEGELEEVKDHPILDLLDNPNLYQEGLEFIKESLTFYLTHGNAYVQGFGATGGLNARKWDSLHVLHPEHVKIVVGKSKYTEPIKEYEYHRQGLHDLVRYEREEILHKKMVNLNYTGGQSLYGMSPAEPLKMTIKSSMEAYKRLLTKFVTGGVQGFLKQNPGDIQITDDQLRQIASAIISSSRRGRIPTTDADLDYVNVGESLVDMDVLGAMDKLLDKICNAYGISSLLLNNKASSTLDNVNQLKKSAYTETVIPLMDDWAKSFTKFLCYPYSESLCLKPDYSQIDVLQENMVEKAQWVNSSPFTLNERRTLLGQQPKEDDPQMEEIWMPANLVPINGMAEEDEDIEDLQRGELE